jgi:hypothetical protein
MLARSRARREKDDTQLTAEVDCTKQRNPLQDYNQTQRLKVTTEGKTCLISEVTRFTKIEERSLVDFNPIGDCALCCDTV